MVAADFLQDPRVRQWLDGVEPAWTLLTFESLRALRHEPSAVHTAIRIANDLARIMHHAAVFCTPGELTRADVPSGGIGVRQLGMQRVRG
jgi:hypothetical protein